MMVWYYMQFVGVLIRLSLLISLDGWMENGRTRPCYRLFNKEYKDTPGHPELQHLDVRRQNNNNYDDDNNKKKINKT